MTLLRSLLLLTATVLPLVASAQPCIDGFAGPYPCQNVDLVAQINGTATDIWGWTDPETGSEYAIIFMDGRTTFVDLSEPSAPLVVGELTTVAGKDARTYADHLFVVDDNGVPGIAVFDLTRLRSVADPPASFAPDAMYDGISSAHNIDLNTASGFAYPVSVGSGTCSGALHMVDVRDPLSPTFAGCFEAGYTFHDTHCVDYSGPDAEYAGREVCFGSSGGGRVLSIVDVTDKADPTLIAEAPYPNASYTHQGWLTEDHRHFLLNDEFDEGNFGINTRTIVFDVSDLDNPEFAFEHFGETAATDHNLFVKGDYVYQANYSAGLHILDLSNIDDAVLTEVAYFDTTPGDEDYFGTWGVYPYFESGLVVISDELRGLFVLRPTLAGTTDTEGEPGVSSALALASYPNPVADVATLELRLDASQRVRVAVYNVLGRAVATLFEGTLEAETHQLEFNAASLPAGSYVIRATGETASASLVVTRAR